MGIISTGPGSPLAFSSASGGKIYGFANISTATQNVAPVNPSRQQITFHNPGTVDIFVAPLVSLNLLGQQAPLNPTTTSLAATFRVYANGGTLVISGECQGAWQALSASGVGNPLTVMDSNV